MNLLILNRNAPILLGVALLVLAPLPGMGHATANTPVFVRAEAIGAANGSSWEDAYTDLQDALAVVETGDEIWVAAGVYNPDRGTGDRSATFELVSGVGIYGGFAGSETRRDQRDPAVNETTLSGDLLGDDGSQNCGLKSDCCVDHFGQGCDDQLCEEKVCAVSSKCCDDPIFPSGDTLDWPCGSLAKFMCCHLTAGTCDNSLNVVTIIDADSSTILDGLTITGGRADAGAELTLESRGGGVLATGGSPAFVNCTFRANSAFFGGAVYLDTCDATLAGCTFSENLSSTGSAAVFSKDSSPTLTDCIFTGNEIGTMVSDVAVLATEIIGPHLVNCRFEENAGGVVFANNGNVSLVGCTFVSNSSAALSSNGGSATLLDCTFIDNGIALVGSSSNVVVTNCRFFGNRGGAINLSAALLINCVFSGNQGGRTVVGPGVARNCTFSDNHPDGTTVSGYLLENCIVWGNTSNQHTGENAQILGDPDSMTVNHSIVEGWSGTFGGVGSFDADPLFIDADGFDDIPGTFDDNLRLQAGSPAINAGNKLALPADTLDLDDDGDTDEPLPVDLDGQPRIQEKALDIGAYEGGNQMIVTSTDDLPVPEGGTASFDVSLLLEPDDMVTVVATIPDGDSDITVQEGNALIFTSTNYAAPQTVTIAAQADAGFVNGSAAVRLSAFGIPLARVTAREVDNDPVPQIVFVDRQAKGANTGMSWADALTQLTDGLAAADEHPEITEIWVAAGVYTPDNGTGDRWATLSLVPGVGLYGGFGGWETQRVQRDWHKNTSILSGDLSGNDAGNPSGLLENAHHVVTAIDANPATVLDGFTITGGNRPPGLPVTFDVTGYGAGMVINSGSPRVENCVFRDNIAVDGGALSSVFSEVVIRNCVFQNNTAYFLGGAIKGRAKMTNCLVIGNVAVYGNAGAIWGHLEPELINCTVVHNESLTEELGGIFAHGVIEEGAAKITGSILWGNSGTEGINEAAQVSSSFRIDYSAVEGWSGQLGGIGNTGDVPLFMDPLGPDGIEATGDEDYRLAQGSPLINRGDPGYLPQSSETDLSGVPRIAGCRIDMGAFESEEFQTMGDFDADERHTLADFAGFQVCLAADIAEPTWLDACLCVFDFDKNETLDLNDFLSFHSLLTGP